MVAGARWIALAFGLSLSLPAAASADSSPIVVVAPIKPRGTSLTAEQVEKLTTLLEGKTGYRVVPRSTIRDWISKQKSESFKECYDDACQIEIGKALAAQKTLIADWASIGNGCVLTAKLIDLRTEVAEPPAQASGPCTETGLAGAIDEVARRLRAQLEQGGITFQLDLEESKRVKNPPTDKTGYLVINAEAQDRPEERIDVYINGELKGQIVGGTFTTLLEVGHYIVLLKTAGDRYAHKRVLIDLGTGRTRFPAQGKFTLPKIFGVLELAGSPSDVTLTIDGRPRVVHTPHSEELRAGQYSVMVEAPGYLAFGPKDITVEAGQKVPIAYSLARNAGALTVNGSPPGARVLVDGRHVGSLPVTLSELDVGGHRITVEAPGHHAAEQFAQISRGDQAAIDVALTEKIARLSVEAIAKVPGGDSPVEAQLYIDGVDRGPTPWKGEIRAEVPHRVELRLSKIVGPRRDLTLAEGEEHRETIPVPSEWGGASARLRFDLVPGPWEARIGEAALDLARPNALRPGHVDVDLYLEGRRVATAGVDAKPTEESLVRISRRPRTPEELDASRSAWRWRKWIALGLAVGAGLVSGEQLIVANQAESQRSSAYVGFLNATSGAELDGYRASVIDLESDRLTAKAISIVSIAVAGAFGAWAALEWLIGEPGVGQIEGDGIVTVEP